MDIQKILAGVDCECGKHHSCDIKKISIKRGACNDLIELCRDYNKILIVADENTYKASKKGVENALSNKNIKRVIFSGDSVVIPNEESVERVREELDGIEIIVGIGSGVMQDLCKYVAHFAKIPYIIVATAPSMDGYASTGAAMILKGMKETVSASLPMAILADTEVLKDAPMEMIKAGYGDIIGKISALCDWKLSRVVNDEYFCQYIYDITYSMIDRVRETAEGLLKRDENSVSALMEALIVVGVMMSFATTSRPASGSEHHLSHFFEITGIIENAEYLPHGIDVALSTVITASLRSELLNISFDKPVYVMPRDEYEATMKRVYGPIYKECISLQDRIGNYKKDRISVYKAKENEIKEILREASDSKKILEMLSLAKLDMSYFDKTYTEDKIKTAIRYAKDLKDRYTVLWMYYDLLGMEEKC